LQITDIHGIIIVCKIEQESSKGNYNQILGGKMKKVRTPEEARKIADDFARLGLGSTFTPPHEMHSFFNDLFNFKKGGKNEKRK